MKTRIHKPFGQSASTSSQNHSRGAFAVIMVLALLSLMLMHSMALSHRMNLLNRELGQLEKEQIARLQRP